MRKRWFGLSTGLLALGALLLASGCGGGGSQAKLRVVNASPNTTGLDVLVDDKTVASGIGYGSNSDYLSVDSGSHHLQVEGSGTTNILLDQTLSFNSDSETTFLVTNFASSISAMVLTDNSTTPASGNATLRIVNAAPSLGAVDVYVVTPGADLVASTPVIRSLAFNAATDYQTLTAGSYEVVFTVPGSTFALIDTGSLNLSSEQNRTVLALNGVSGGFTATLLADLN
jgi:hypothetical protein